MDRHEEEQGRLVVRDKRRLDPQTGDLRAAGAVSAPDTNQAGDAKEAASMTDSNQLSSGDDAFGGAVGDDLPGAADETGYQGRHAQGGEADGADRSVPSGWPGAGDDPVGNRPTSPATSQASAAAARAAYADAPRGADPSAQQAQQAGESDPSAHPTPPGAPGEAGGEHPDSVLAAERLADLQRLQAEYVNYKRRVDRDRAVEKGRAVAGVIESLLPVLDEIYLARQHGELEDGPFAKIAEKLEGVLARHGVQRYGQAGDSFDPMVHEAVMHTQAELAPGTTQTTVVQVMQPGYKLGDRVVRAALVAVADPV